MIVVSQHARIRWTERVQPCSLDEARDHILSHSRAIEAAIRFGASVVRLSDRTRLILDGPTVVTVMGPGQTPRQCLSQHYTGAAA